VFAIDQQLLQIPLRSDALNMDLHPPQVLAQFLYAAVRWLSSYANSLATATLPETAPVLSFSLMQSLSCGKVEPKEAPTPLFKRSLAVRREGQRLATADFKAEVEKEAAKKAQQEAEKKADEKADDQAEKDDSAKRPAPPKTPASSSDSAKQTVTPAAVRKPSSDRAFTRYECDDDDPFLVRTFRYQCETQDGGEYRERILKFIPLLLDTQGHVVEASRMAYRSALDALDPDGALKLEYCEVVPDQLLAVAFDVLPGVHNASTAWQFCRLWKQLRALHNANPVKLVHCDVRAANMVFGRDGTDAWLIDFEMTAPPETPYVAGYSELVCRHLEAKSEKSCHPEHDLYSLGFEMQQYEPTDTRLRSAWKQAATMLMNPENEEDDPFAAVAAAAKLQLAIPGRDFASVLKDVQLRHLRYAHPAPAAAPEASMPADDVPRKR